MSSLESSTVQNSDDTNQASSQPKIITNEVLIDPVAQSMEQENDETKLANQVVEPMSRDNEKETETLEENAVKTKTTGVAKDVKSLTRDDTGLGFIGISLCFMCCVCCGYVLCFPCVQCFRFCGSKFQSDNRSDQSG
ncbi:hypothetical protein DCAR_0205339 [Daucus carota subsp. sativus]|uniref:Uncharacterized protein n=1 Tax=Daucus carota subsp. sativus TaxID=79200 RepID=A0A161WZ49_DAUCS|nr:hypothetical protein DCAR_0205339 [Daucus carota subsp. sativus]